MFIIERGKATVYDAIEGGGLPLAAALESPVAAWHELLTGRVLLELSWRPLLDDGGTLGAPTALTLKPPPPLLKREACAA